MQSKWKYFLFLCGIRGSGRDEMPDLSGCLFSYTVFVMVVAGQCCTVKFHFIKLSNCFVSSFSAMACMTKIELTPSVSHFCGLTALSGSCPSFPCSYQYLV